MAAEIVKHRVNAGKRPELYWFRDQQGLEVDFVVPQGERRLMLVEAKAARTVMPADAASLERLASAATDHDVERVVVHRRATTAAGTTLRPGTRALDVEGLLRRM